MKLHILYFSPTGGVRQVAQKMGHALIAHFGDVLSVSEFDFTLPQNRVVLPAFTADDVVLLALPVYAGRVPNLLLPYLKNLCGSGAKAIAMVVYGNRAYDDALVELCQLMQMADFNVQAAGAFVARHAFTDLLAGNRPDAEDYDLMFRFAQAIADKCRGRELSREGEMYSLETLKADLGKPLHYYRPKDAAGNAIDMLRVKPITTAQCNGCGICAAHCPLGSISVDNPKEVVGKCMKCCSCVRCCPQQAKAFTDPGFIYHRDDLVRCFGKTRGRCEVFV